MSLPPRPHSQAKRIVTAAPTHSPAPREAQPAQRSGPVLHSSQVARQLDLFVRPRGAR
jgi:hypothetical protein